MDLGKSSLILGLWHLRLPPIRIYNGKGRLCTLHSIVGLHRRLPGGRECEGAHSTRLRPQREQPQRIARVHARAPGRVQPSSGRACLCAAPPPGASPLTASTRPHRSPSQRHGHTPHRPCGARAKGSRRMQRLGEMAFRPSPPRAAQRVAVGRRGRRRRPGERGGPTKKKG